MNESLKLWVKLFTTPGLRSQLKMQIDKITGQIAKKQNVGRRSYVDASVQVLGWKNVKIGQNSIVSEDSLIVVNHRQAEHIAVAIGNNCFVGRRNVFVAGSSIEINDFCLLGPNCKFLGSDHIYNSPFVPYITSGSTDDGVIEIGHNCWLGADVIILKNVKIGYGSIIGAATVVNRDVPPLSIVVGNPGRVVKRFNMQTQAWVRVDDYPEDGDQFLLKETEYLERLKQTQFDMKYLRVASSQRFGDL